MTQTPQRMTQMPPAAEARQETRTRHVSPLAHLVQDGVLVRTAGRLRVSSRYLAHAERLAAQAGILGRHSGLGPVFEQALRSHGYGGDIPTAAGYLMEFLAERGQLGGLQPVFGTPHLVLA